VTTSASLPTQPHATATVQEWIDWFYAGFLPYWIKQARDPHGFGYFDLLDDSAKPLQPERRTLLAQARLLFTFAHLAIQTDNPVFKAAADVAKDALQAFQKSPGLYRRAQVDTQNINQSADDNLAFSYDQTFVILGLSTWGRLDPTQDVSDELESCWQAIENHLTDAATGLLLEHDEVTDPKHKDAPWRAQNPHMHLYEAALQAYEMSQNPVWLERAKHIRAKGLEFFFDHNTGTLIEFIAADLKTLSARDGQRREIGHQCEWAWLLYREVELGGDPDVHTVADALLNFADAHGVESTGPMAGAAFDAVSSDTAWREETFLLWPQTEAIKTYAIRHLHHVHAEKGQHLMLLVFKHYFKNHAAFVNQLDNQGNPIWPEALSRLLYHVVLAVTEGARAGLWQTPE